MDQYVTGALIKRLREEKQLTQQELAAAIGVSDKAVSKWETGHGYPDITLLEPIARALQLSLIELFSGADVANANRASNMLRMKFYVCPVCGNVILASGEAVVSCCGITLPSLDAEEPDEDHPISVERIEDEYFVSLPHEMSKTHHISFIAAVQGDGCDLRKLYPEGNAETRVKIRGTKAIYVYCNRHGLFCLSV